MGIVKIIKLRREAKGCSPDRHDQSNQRSRITLKLRVPAQGPNALATPSGPGVPVSGRNQAPHIPQENITKCDWCAVSMSYIFCPRPLSLMFFSPSTDIYIFVPEKHRGRHFPYSCFSFGVLPARTKPVSQARSVDFSVVLVCY